MPFPSQVVALFVLCLLIDNAKASLKPLPSRHVISLDVERLILEHHFDRYVRDAFNPVGIMLDFWEAESAPATPRSVRVIVFNDLEHDWSGRVRLQIEQSSRTVTRLSQPVRLKGYERQILTCDCTLPTQPGRYTMIAELAGPGPNPRSLRDLTLAPP